MGKQLWIVVTALALAQAAHARPDEPGADRIEIAYQARDLDGVERARAAVLQSGTPSSHYYSAYARLRQALLAEDDADRARTYIDACIEELRPLIERVPADAEARALLGSCLGVSTRYHRLAMATRGLEARRQIATARSLAPANPWVVLQDGLADYETPRLFGGDRKLGIEKVERATGLFTEAMQAGSRLAAWGAAEAWQQLGEMYQETGRAEDARIALENARRLAPAGQQLAAL